MKTTTAFGLSACLWVGLTLGRLAEGIVPDFGQTPLLAAASAVTGLGVGLLSLGTHQPQEELLSALLRLLILLTTYALLGLFYLSPDPAGDLRSLIGLLAPVILFLGHALVFIPLGRALSPSLGSVAARSALETVLAAAGFNTGLYLLLALLDTPVVRFLPAAAFLLLWGLALKLPRRGLGLSGLLMAMCLVLTAVAGWRLTWSSHVLLPVPDGSLAARALSLQPTGPLPGPWTGVIIDGFRFDFSVDLDPIRLGMLSSRAPREAAVLTGMMEFYRLPFRLRPPGRALVLNSGLGNTLAAGGREGWQALEAQEDDPALLRLGLSHPERPYHSPGIVLHRAPIPDLVREVSGTFDLIVIAPVLAQPAFWNRNASAHPFPLFTAESLKAIGDRLSSDGILALAVSAPHGFVERRLHQMLSEQFGTASSWSWRNPAWDETWTLIAAGPGISRYRPRPGAGLEDITAEMKRRPSLDPATRSWPFFLLPGPGLSFTLFLVLLGVALVTAGLFMAGRAFNGLRPGLVMAGGLFALILLRDWGPVPRVAVWALSLSALAAIPLFFGGVLTARRAGSACAGFGLAGATGLLLPWLGDLWPLLAGAALVLLLAGTVATHARK